MLLKKILILFLFALFTCTPNVQAQDNYSHAIGFRGGPNTGISYKRYVTFAGAIDGFLGFNFTNGRVLGLTALYEYHFFMNYKLNFFAGGGISLGGNATNAVFGVDAVVGLDYTLPRFPMNFSIDYKPSFRPFQQPFGDGLYYNEFGVSIRYIIQY